MWKLNKTLRDGESVGVGIWGQRVEEQIGCDNFYGTQGCGVNLGINNGNNYNDTNRWVRCIQWFR